MTNTNEEKYNYATEYLLILNKDRGLCTTIEGLKSALSMHEEIQINGNKIKWREDFFLLDISTGEIKEEGNPYFHLKISTEIDKVEKFTELLRVIRTILTTVNNNTPPEVIWDDISTQYAIEAYPIIHNIENLMRKLITKFMLITVGKAWSEKNVPEVVIKSIIDSKKTQINFLYSTDFIQLANFLFKPYYTGDLKRIQDSIKKVKKSNDLDLKELQSIVPKSNWNRYFKPLLDCHDAELEKKWHDLYKLRCKVAHNNFLDSSDSKNIKQICSDLENVLRPAIDKIDEVKITEEDKTFMLNEGELLIIENAREEKPLTDYLHNKFKIYKNIIWDYLNLEWGALLFHKNSDELVDFNLLEWLLDTTTFEHMSNTEKDGIKIKYLDCINIYSDLEAGKKVLLTDLEETKKKIDSIILTLKPK